MSKGKEFPPRRFIREGNAMSHTRPCVPVEKYIEYLSLAEHEHLVSEARRGGRSKGIEAVGLELGKRFHPAADAWFIAGNALTAAKASEGVSK